MEAERKPLGHLPDTARLTQDLRATEARLAEIIRLKRVGRDVNAAHDQTMTVGPRVADQVAATMGSWHFIIIQSVILAAWIALNVTELFVHAWDPYPFILLNLALSFQAAYAAPIIMMSQNRQAAKDRLGAELDLQTNLKAESLIEEIHGGMDDLRLAKWEALLHIQQEQITLLESLVNRRGNQGIAPTSS